MAEKKKAQTVKVGDRLDLEKPANYVGLPDGSVVTARRYYTVEHEGRHVIDGTEYQAVKPADERDAK